MTESTREQSIPTGTDLPRDIGPASTVFSGADCSEPQVRENLARTSPVSIGIDVGSTTVKATVVDPETHHILWSDYRRHQTHQPETVRDFMAEIQVAFPLVPPSAFRLFVTGSGAHPLAVPLNAKFVQEVNAITLAVERLHSDVGSVVELGGQDAKIVIFKVHPATGEIQSQASMNDKCASGTGATIDKCMLKVGISPEELATIKLDPDKLHHVAAKCGVFAETDVVSLVKSGVPSPEILCSLADAIVQQNLSVLTRGSTLRPKVLLLGGPNTYLPFLQECWRRRIVETWEERGMDYPREVPLESLIYVPDNPLLYAAFGAVMFGLSEPESHQEFQGLEQLDEFIQTGRKAHLANRSGPPLVKGARELESFRERFAIPEYTPAVFARGQRVRGVIGVDGGSTSTKAVLMGEDGAVLKKEYKLSQGNPIKEVKEMLASIRKYVIGQGAELEVTGFGATGYAADVLEKTLRADVNIVETVAHMKSAVSLCGETDVICDVGGQDIKVLFLHNGELRNFRLSNQCSAGNGMLLQAMADQFGVRVEDYAEHAFRAGFSPLFSYGCAVFLDSDRVTFQKEGFTDDELMAGLAMVLPKNIWQYVVQIPRMAELGTRYVLQGGTQYNQAAVMAQVDYILERVPGAHISLHPHPGEAGAIGAAMETLRVVNKRGHSTFVGMDQAIGMEYETRTDESTRCNFCQNNCPRTFIDSKTPAGLTARYISGFSCERGTVADVEALKVLTRERRERMKEFPNLAAHEAKQLFVHSYDPDPLPEPTVIIDSVEVKKGWLGKMHRSPARRPFQRSSDEAARRRAEIRIGLPRCLDMWSSGPFWRAYFETLGIPPRHIIWSDESGEEMFAVGGKYGSVDPCYPSKVAQAHIHNLLFRHHQEDRPLNYIFFPTIPQAPTFLQGLPGPTACPVVTGTPNVIKAAFTKETDFFASRGIEYLDDTVCYNEPVLARHQLFSMWGNRLGITEDESDFAFAQGHRAMAAFNAEMEARGREVLEDAERDNRICVLLLGRPYHLDPGLNHAVPEDFQALGYPVLTIRSIPKDPKWLRRFFQPGEDGRPDPHQLGVQDVWPESNNTNSAQKVWAAKFAARHPNVAVLDLSSFKCGHDAPIYGLIDNIVNTAKVPYSAMHDVDANKPSGSFKIRVNTYAHTLKLRTEQLEDWAGKMRELDRQLAAKRRELASTHLLPGTERPAVWNEDLAPIGEPALETVET